MRRMLLNYFSTYQYQILKLNNKKMRFLQHFSECILRMKIHKFTNIQTTGKSERDVTNKPSFTID